ncbi:MAG TPA: hypothetical protein VIA06_04390 [Candidatus Dormibacteraeota bacterium]|jgi:hypothetical protein|nr:hypothetical protein [Candidatus Dormibacteraeota bacterium]
MVKVGGFVCDVTPPMGSPLCLGLVEPARAVDDALQCRGLVILGREAPIVLCAVDWVGIANSSHLHWRSVLAQAAGTSPERVAVHTVHQHDAPGVDADAESIMARHELRGQGYLVDWSESAVERVAAAVRQAAEEAVPVTHLGLGKAEVSQVASTRRVLGPDGHVVGVRYSATRDARLRAAPEGIIDPYARAVTMWEDDRLVASLSYYATHPQSYYGQGRVSRDFPGLARDPVDERWPKAWIVHFCGAAGNVTAGKYNDGAPENRPILAQRLGRGINQAVQASRAQRVPLADADVKWAVKDVGLPPALHMEDAGADDVLEAVRRGRLFRIARDAAYARRFASKSPITLSCLTLGTARILHLPAELFVEYQLCAQQMRPDLFVAMAAYGDYGPGYIGTRVAYPQGGYEVGRASRVSTEAEDILTNALRDLLDAPEAGWDTPSEVTTRAPRGPLPESADSVAP